MRWLVPFIISLVVTPLLIHGLGGERYGILAIANSTVSLVGFVGVGFNDALIKFLSQARSLDDQTACARLIRSNLFLFVVACCTITLLVIGLSPWLVEYVIRPTPELYEATRWVVIISGITFGLSLVAGSFAATLAAAERYDLHAVGTIVLVIISGIGQIAIAFFFPDIVLYSLWNSISAVLKLGVMAFLFHRIFPAVSIVPRPFRDALVQLSGFSTYRILDAVFGLAYFQFDRVLIGMFVGVSNLMYYSIPATVSQMIGHAMNTFTMPLVPKVSVLQAHNKWDELRELYLKATRLVAWLTLTAVVILVFLAGPLLQVWLGGDFASRSSSVLQWLGVGVGIAALGSVATNTLFGLGMSKVNAAIRFVQSLASLGGIALFVPSHGIVGAGWGLVIGQAVTGSFLIIYTERVLEMRLGTTLISGLLRPLGVGFTLGIAAAVLVPLVASLVSIAGILGTLAVLSVVLAVVFQVFDPRQLTRLLRFVRP